METKKHTLTFEDVKKVWHLHKKGTQKKEIGYLLDISKPQVERIISVMTKAENKENIREFFGNNHLKLQEYAMRYFNWSKEDIDQLQSKVKAVNTKVDQMNTELFFIRVLENLERQTSLLEELINELK